MVAHFSEGQAVRVTGNVGVGIVERTTGHIATVTFSVPTSQVEDAGPVGRALLASAERERRLIEELADDRALRAAADIPSVADYQCRLADQRALRAASAIPRRA